MRQEKEATLMAPVLSSMETKQTRGTVNHFPLQRAGEVAALGTGGGGIPASYLLRSGGETKGLLSSRPEDQGGLKI